MGARSILLIAGGLAVAMAARPEVTSTSPAPSPSATPSPSSSPVIGDLPPPLACLQRWYAGKAEKRAGAWMFVLPDGTAIPYDDGRAKTVEEKLDRPDVEDAFSMRYQTGAISAVDDAARDPGRIRLDAVFRATYGTGQNVNVVRTSIVGQKLPVHTRARDAFERVDVRLKKALAADPSLKPLLTGMGGTFVQRNIAGTDRPSAHSYGVSLDLNASLSDYWRWAKGPRVWRNRVPAVIVDAFEAEGFVWGGRWYHYDTMHFEWRPELLDPECYPK